MYRLALLTGILALLTGCSSLQDLNPRPAAMINWVDLIKLNDITYFAERSSTGRPLEKADLGPEFARVQFKLADNIKDPGYQLKNGDAAFLDRDTPIYTVQGYAPQFRLAATRDGQIVLYEAGTNPNAKSGSDLLDLRDKVQTIVVVSAEDGATELAKIEDTQQITRLVELILDAPVDQDREMQGDPGPNYFLEFRLKDGTATSRMYWHGSVELVRGIFLPPKFAEAINAAYQPPAPASTTPSADS